LNASEKAECKCTCIEIYAEREMKSKYGHICENQHASFTPLCSTVDGQVGPEVYTFIKHLSGRLSVKWNRPYTTALNWVRTKISFALVRATHLCI
uniref:Uncharacterized protein n=1 Tax=Amphimedon queenslandica TaxID=400682 RepID=A0A1X7UJK8_AMPQE